MRNRIRRWCSGHSFVRSCDSAVVVLIAVLNSWYLEFGSWNLVVGIWTQKFQANVDYCCVGRREETRRAHVARARTQSYTSLCLLPVWLRKRRAEALYVASEPSTMTNCCLLRTRITRYYRMIRSHERRAGCAALRCFSWSLGPSPRRPTTVFCPPRGAAIAFAHSGCIRTSTHRSLLVLLLCIPGSTQLGPVLTKKTLQIESIQIDIF